MGLLGGLEQKEQAFRQLHHFVQASLQPQSAAPVVVTAAAAAVGAASAGGVGGSGGSSGSSGSGSVAAAAAAAAAGDSTDHLAKLLARCYLRLGQWQESLQGINEQSIPAVLQYYAAATEHDPVW